MKTKKKTDFSVIVFEISKSSRKNVEFQAVLSLKKNWSLRRQNYTLTTFKSSLIDELKNALTNSILNRTFINSTEQRFCLSLII